MKKDFINVCGGDEQGKTATAMNGQLPVLWSIDKEIL
jgi:hypothetical protein